MVSVRLEYDIKQLSVPSCDTSFRFVLTWFTLYLFTWFNFVAVRLEAQYSELIFEMNESSPYRKVLKLTTTGVRLILTHFVVFR